MSKMTWKELLIFLLQEKEMGRLLEDHYVMVHNIETGDEHHCDTLILDNTNRLVLGIDYSED